MISKPSLLYWLGPEGFPCRVSTFFLFPFSVQLFPLSSHLCKCYSVTLPPPEPFFCFPCLCHHSPSKHVFLYVRPWCHLNCLFMPPFLNLSTERYVVRALLLCCVQGNEPHAVHRLRSAGPGESIRYLAHHAKYDCRSYLLCCFYWPCNGSHPIPGLLQTAVSGKGEELRQIISVPCSQHVFICEILKSTYLWSLVCHFIHISPKISWYIWYFWKPWNPLEENKVLCVTDHQTKSLDGGIIIRGEKVFGDFSVWVCTDRPTGEGQWG